MKYSNITSLDSFPEYFSISDISTQEICKLQEQLEIVVGDRQERHTLPPNDYHYLLVRNNKSYPNVVKAEKVCSPYTENLFTFQEFLSHFLTKLDTYELF